VTDEATYQMLWDCPFCGTKKLLGLDHRHCPSCGATQDPEWRYFPSDDEKIAVEDHEFTGADKNCPACGTANSSKTAFCVNCGSPMDGSAAVKTRSDQVQAEGTAFADEGAKAAQEDFKAQKTAARAPQAETPPKKKKKSKVGCVVGCLVLGLLAVLVLVAVAVLWKKPASVAVVGHSWERTIDIEEYRSVSESEWCDSKPSDAYSVRKESKVRSHNKVPDGEDCSTRRVDNGDGTFSEKRECKPKYREEPVYDDWCSYSVDRWKKDRTVRADGSTLSETPAWPVVKLSRTGTCKGCEREGPRGETYTVRFASPEGKSHTCDFSQTQWATYAAGSEYESKVGVLTGKLDCGGLTQIR
jgi:hypothetical protein